MRVRAATTGTGAAVALPCATTTGRRHRATRASWMRCRVRRRRRGCRTSSSASSGCRRSCCRSTRRRGSSTASAGRSWPRSTRSRPTTAATSTCRRPVRWAGCSSCPRPGAAYGTDANKDGRKDPYNPVDAIFAAARYLEGRRLRGRRARRDLGLQPRRLVRRLGAAAGPPDRRRARRPDRLADRAHRRPLPRLRTRALRRRPGRGRAAQARQARRERGQRDRVDRRPAAASTSSPSAARRWWPSTTA